MEAIHLQPDWDTPTAAPTIGASKRTGHFVGRRLEVDRLANEIVRSEQGTTSSPATGESERHPSSTSPYVKPNESHAPSTATLPITGTHHASDQARRRRCGTE
jgi:hypothetical protein